MAALKATGKKQLIIAGTITSVCMVFPEYQLLIESYLKAREVEHNHEQLDSERQ